MSGERTLKDIYDEFTEDQKTFLHNWVGEVIEHPGKDYTEQPNEWERKILGSMTNEQKELCWLMVSIVRADATVRRRR